MGKSVLLYSLSYVTIPSLNIQVASSRRRCAHFFVFLDFFLVIGDLFC